MKKILCAGAITTDILVCPADTIPEPGTLRSVESITTSVGGCATNCAIDLGKLGVPVAVSGRVGKDIYGDFVRSELIKNNVDAKPLVAADSSPTTLSVACIRSWGERSFMYNPASSANYCLDDVDWQAVEDCDIVFYTGAMLLTSFDGAPCAEFLKKCREMGKFTVLDTAWDFDGIWFDKIASVFDGLDLFMPSIDEAKNISGKEEIADIAEFFFEKGVKNIIIKDGANGAFLQKKGEEIKHFPTYTEIKPVDTTGAGDSFCSGFLAGLAMDWSFEDSVKFGNAVGTHCIMEIGASAGIKSIDETLEFMKNHKI